MTLRETRGKMRTERRKKEQGKREERGRENTLNTETHQTMSEYEAKKSF